MTLRPPRPDLRGVWPDGRVELRKTDKNGLSVARRPRFAADLHDSGGRDVLVFVRPGSDRLPIVTRAGDLTYGLEEHQLTTEFRHAFYANRDHQRATIDEHRLDKRDRDLQATGTSAEASATPPPLPPAPPRPAPPDSPLDALRPLARLGWPFDELREMTPDPEETPHAEPLRRL